jgi:hypothetical protein
MRRHVTNGQLPLLDETVVGRAQIIANARLRQMRQELIWQGVQVIERMEREIGLESTTSSLGS